MVEAHVLYHAKFYGIPCWFLYDDENTICGKNFLCDWLIELAVFFHNTSIFLALLPSGCPFPVRVVKEATKQEKVDFSLLYALRR